MVDVVMYMGPAQHYHGDLHEELKLVWVSSGYVIERRGNQYRAGSDQLIVLHPGEAHSGWPDEQPPGEWRIICVPQSLVAKVADPGSLRFEPPVVGEPAITERFLAMFELFEKPVSQAEREDGLVELVAALVPYAVPNGSREPLNQADHDAAQKVREYLESRTSTNIRLDELAGVARMDKFRLVRACTNQFGLSPHALHLRLRLTRARELIRQGRQLSDVGHDTGFYDQAHFSRTFTRIYGMTPTQYRAALTNTCPH